MILDLKRETFKWKIKMICISKNFHLRLCSFKYSITYQRVSYLLRSSPVPNVRKGKMQDDLRRSSFKIDQNYPPGKMKIGKILGERGVQVEENEKNYFLSFPFASAAGCVFSLLKQIIEDIELLHPNFLNSSTIIFRQTKS